MKFKSLQFRRRGAVGVLLLNRPAKRNALSDAMVAELGQDAGLLMESLAAGIVQSEPEAKKRMKDFLEKRVAKVRRDG